MNHPCPIHIISASFFFHLSCFSSNNITFFTNVLALCLPDDFQLSPPLPHPYHQRLLRPPLRPPALLARLPSSSRRVQRQTLGVGLQIFLPSVSKDFYPCRVKCPTFGFCLSVRTKTDFTQPPSNNSSDFLSRVIDRHKSLLEAKSPKLQQKPQI